jgi:predicted ATPase/DNA-binding SARP family transcriptional activator
MNPAVQVRILGPLEVDRAGQPCVISSPLQRRLLTALTIAAGTTLAAEQLIDQLWGEDPPPAARNSLQSHVARLRGLIGAGTILTRPPGYALDLACVVIDAVRFERAVEEARAQLGADPARAVSILETALAEWRGAAHAEFAEDLARSDALRLENLRIDARRLLAEAHQLTGDHPAAVDTILRLQGDVPLREDVAIVAACALHAAGRTTEALELLRTYRARLNDELGLDPGEVVAEVERQLLRGEAIEVRAPVPVRARHPVGRTEAPAEDATSAPTPPPYSGTQMLGRDEESEQIARLLRQARLVTLVGFGGVGKTRLATVVAREWGDPDGQRVAWVDLTTLTSPTDVAPVIIECLGLTSPDRVASETAAAALARFEGVVVLDNCEHVLDTVAAVVGLALGRDGHVRILATSRERLDVAGERVVLVRPLPVPDPDTASEQDASVQLFQDRLTATGSGAVTNAEAAQIVAAVDGLPLAIELAAARAATLSVEELLARLDHHLGILAGSPRRHGARHQTLSNVIAWSYDLLPAREQTVLRRASVFASSFRLIDAERVCAGSGVTTDDVVEAIARLVETSILTRVGAGRYRLLEPLRVFTREQLEHSEDAEETWDRHRTAMLALAARADEQLTGPDEAGMIAELEEALPDLRSVHARALSVGDLTTIAQLAGRLYRFAYAQARGDVLSWGGRLADADAADLDPDERLRAIAASVPAEVWHNNIDEALRRASLCTDHLDDAAADPWSGVTVADTVAEVHLMRGELEEAVALYERGVGLARRCEHVGLTSYMLSGLSIATAFLGDRTKAIRIAEEAAELAHVAASPTATSLAAYALGEAVAEDDPDRALAAFATAVTAASAVRAAFFEAIARTADVALRGRHGDPEAAFSRYRAALGIWSEASADGMALTTLRNLVILLARTGADTDALSLHTALERLASRPSYGPEAEGLRTALATVRQRLHHQDVARAEAYAGDLTDLGAAIRFGLASIDRGRRRLEDTRGGPGSPGR